MKNVIYSCLILLLTFCFACKNESKENPNQKPVEEVNESSTKEGPTQMIVNLDKLRLRDSPGEKGKEVALLLKGTVLEDLGEVSDFTTKVKLRGVPYDEPWIKVKTQDLSLIHI